MPTITIKEKRTQSAPVIKEHWVDLQDGLSLVGFILLETGIAKIYFPASLICAGLICLLPFITGAVTSIKRATRSNNK